MEFAERFDLCSLQLNVNSPALGEEYHAMWERKARPSISKIWHIDVPLQSRGITMGRLRIAGGVNRGPVLEWMAELMDGLKPFEIHFLELLDDPAVAAPVIANLADADSVDVVSFPTVNVRGNQVASS